MAAGRDPELLKIDLADIGRRQGRMMRNAASQPTDIAANGVADPLKF
jgi:hypothetical protein